MARGINKVILIGNLGKDPDVKYLPSGMAVVNVSLATSESWKDKDSGDKKDHTEWHNLVFMGKVAEIAGQYLKKGSKVYIEGSLRTRKWQDKETGKDRYTTEIRVRDMQMLDGRSGGGTESYDDEPATPPPSAGRGKPRPAADSGDTLDDDIPF